MKKWLLALLMLSSSAVFAADSSIELESADNDLRNKASLQRGAKLFMNYCFGCHSTMYQRYERVATDLEIPNDLMLQNLVFDPNAKIGDLMDNAMSHDNAVDYFGTAVPDLTLAARVRGTDWLYTYLLSFYQDPARPFGVNNLLYPNVGMPHVLEELQGTPVKVTEQIEINGERVEQIIGTESLGNGELSIDEYDSAIRDLVNFLDYSAEPVKLERQSLGYWVIGFFVIFLILSVLLKKEYWRDVH